MTRDVMSYMSINRVLAAKQIFSHMPDRAASLAGSTAAYFSRCAHRIPTTDTPQHISSQLSTNCSATPKQITISKVHKPSPALTHVLSTQGIIAPKSQDESCSLGTVAECEAARVQHALRDSRLDSDGHQGRRPSLPLHLATSTAVAVVTCASAVKKPGPWNTCCAVLRCAPLYILN